jgi:hypothetical protein
MAERLAADVRNYWVVTPEPGFVIKTKVLVIQIPINFFFSAA